MTRNWYDEHGYWQPGVDPSRGIGPPRWAVRLWAFFKPRQGRHHEDSPKHVRDLRSWR